MMHHGENLVYNQMNSSSNNNNISPPHTSTNIGRVCVCARKSNFARVCCSTYLLASCIGSNEHSHLIFFSKMLLATIDTKAYTVCTLRVCIRPPAFPPFLSLLSSHSYVLSLSVSDLTVPTCWCEAEREKSEWSPFHWSALPGRKWRTLWAATSCSCCHPGASEDVQADEWFSSPGRTCSSFLAVVKTAKVKVSLECKHNTIFSQAQQV